jgi:hypothetical protein
MKYLKLLLVVSVIGIQIAAFAYAPDNGEKITVCHIPPGDPENMHEIDISVNALDAHLAHGDRVGACRTVTAVEWSSRVN